jgi:tripartite ATP-independent transporter DctM subunit
MIPPSNLAVLLGAVGEISVGRLLIAIVIPGVLMAVLFSAYIIIRCWLQPSVAPSYAMRAVPLSEKLSGLLRYVLPLVFVVFLCIGVIFVGVATPSEAAATGALGTFILAACYRKLNWKLVWDSVNSTVQVTIMVLTIIAGAFAFSQILAFSGVNMSLSNFAVNLPVAPIMIVIAMMLVSVFLGMFINMTSIIVLTVPIFVPMVQALGYDPVWFGAMYMLTIEMAGITPPFGLTMFAMKGVAPRDTTMQDIYGACLPYVALDTVALVLMLVFPAITLWLPNLMR